MLTSWMPPALNDIDAPRHVKIVSAQNFSELHEEIGRRSVMGYSGQAFFGTAFIQGFRLQFSTAMPISLLLRVSSYNRARKGDGVELIDQHSNRPREPKHSKQLRAYLLENACAVGQKFILPAFTFNYGVGLTDESPEATLILLDMGDDGVNTWPAILLLPPSAKLDTTDGAHRRAELEELVGPKSAASQQQQDALLRNAVDVKIVFESSFIDSHQDFADCAKAKTLPSSLVTNFDVRDSRNAITKALVKALPFFLHYIDATAANVNLSSGSKNIWSMSAMRMFASTTLEAVPSQTPPSPTVPWVDAIAFLTAVVAAIPTLRVLDLGRITPDPLHTPGKLRDVRGGNILLRGVGLMLLARAFVHCLEKDVPFVEMAERLATVDWHMLDCEREELGGPSRDDGEQFAALVVLHTNPLWRSLLVMRESGFRIGSIRDAVNHAWDRLVGTLYPPPLLSIMAVAGAAAD